MREVHIRANSFYVKRDAAHPVFKFESFADSEGHAVESLGEDEEMSPSKVSFRQSILRAAGNRTGSC